MHGGAVTRIRSPQQQRPPRARPSLTTVAPRDLDKAASRFLNALRRITSGLDTQQQRVLDRAAAAPRLLPGFHIEVIDLTGDTGNDLDYYIYELGRLEATGRSLIKVFSKPQQLVAAQTAFNLGIPKLKQIRDPLTHPNDNDELDDVGWFSSVVRHNDDGRTETLVDPRYGHHDTALAYSNVLQQHLRAHIAAAITADPPLSMSEQIAKRDIKARPVGPE